MDKEVAEIFKDNPIKVINIGSEKIICQQSNYIELVIEYLKKGKMVEAPNGDWYEKERNMDFDKWIMKKGFHIIRYPQGTSPFERLNDLNDFIKNDVPKIWKSITTENDKGDS